MNLLELAERCEAAAGPDLELDYDITLALGLAGRSALSVVRFTASPEAAMTLVPEGDRAALAICAAALRARHAQGMPSLEEWRPSPVFGDAYEVSNTGRVRSVRGVKSPYRDKDGYPTVNLHSGGKRKACNVHRLVALAFHAEGQNALHNEVAHLDGDRTNPSASNLKWVSKVENHFHMRLHGTHQHRANHGAAKLTEEQVAEIAATPSGAPRGELAEKFGVSKSAITDIRSGRSWRP